MSVLPLVRHDLCLLPYWTVGMNTFWVCTWKWWEWKVGRSSFCVPPKRSVQPFSPTTFLGTSPEFEEIARTQMFHVVPYDTLKAELLAHRFWDHVGTFFGFVNSYNQNHFFGGSNDFEPGRVWRLHEIIGWKSRRVGRMGGYRITPKHPIGKRLQQCMAVFIVHMFDFIISLSIFFYL